MICMAFSRGVGTWPGTSPVLVVLGALLGVREHRIGLLDALERHFVATLFVRVVLLCPGTGMQL
jgi:hypothetical protein